MGVRRQSRITRSLCQTQTSTTRSMPDAIRRITGIRKGLNMYFLLVMTLSGPGSGGWWPSQASCETAATYFRNQTPGTTTQCLPEYEGKANQVLLNGKQSIVHQAR